MQVSLDLIEDILGGTSENDGASGWVLAFLEEGEIVITDLLDLEDSALCSNIRFLELLGPVNNGGS